jgi:ferredoxin-type protein NapH
MKFQLFRKLIQSASLFFIVYAALSGHWRNFKVAHNSSRIVGLMTNETWGEVYYYNERLLSWFGDPLAVSDTMTGGPWAARFAGITFIDPLAALALVAGGNAPVAATLLGAALPLLIALLMGRVFCSFLCPARLLFEIGNGVRRALIWMGLSLPEVRIPRLGLWVAAASVLFAAGAGPGIFQYLLPYLAINAGLHGYLFSGALVSTAVWAVLMVLVDMLIAPGQICHSICPTGALLEQVGRPAMLRVVRSDPECPPSCDVCQRACPYGLYPGHKTHRPACDTCGRCVAVCPQKKLSHAGRLPWAAMLAAAVLLLPASAMAHHNKGLPHYGYFENYPQVPTQEFIDEDERWEVGAVLFNFQGLERRTSDTPTDVRIFAYIYDLQENHGYKGPLTLHLHHNDQRIVSFERVAADPEGVYTVRYTMPETDWYELVFEIPVEDDVAIIPLDIHVDLSSGDLSWWLLGGAGALLLLTFGLANTGRRAKAVRRAPAARED